MLSPSALLLWQAYLTAESTGLRAEALAALDRFLAALPHLPPEQWRPWALDFAAAAGERGDPTPLRASLFRQAIFPALLHGLQHDAPDCARLLAGLFQQVHRTPGLLDQLPETLRHPEALLRHALATHPSDLLALESLLRMTAQDFAYMLHELPSGLLYLSDGATSAQCLELLVELDEFETLAAAAVKSDQHRELIARSRFHLSNYRAYLLARASGDTYTAWLATHPEPAAGH